MLLQGNDVDGFTAVVHLGQRAKNRLVAQVVEDFRALFEFLDTLAQAFVGREQHAAQDALLSFGRMRRQPVHLRSIGGRQSSPRRPF